MKKALILGITSQDGLLLAKYLLSLGYSVTGTTRGLTERSKNNLQTLKIVDFIEIVTIDLCNPQDLRDLLSYSSFDEIYNLAAQSSVARSFIDPSSTFQSIVISASILLQSVVDLQIRPRIFNACSSECFGSTSIDKPFDENSPFLPISPYAIAKHSAFLLFNNYRRIYNLPIYNGILFNHESPFRSPEFVSQKICLTAKKIYDGETDYIELGNLDVVRDWGWAPEYVVAMNMLLQHEDPVDLIISTGKSFSLHSFARLIFSQFSLNLDSHLSINPSFVRSSDLNSSYSSPVLINKLLGWQAFSFLPQIASKLVNVSLNQDYLSDPFAL